MHTLVEEAALTMNSTPSASLGGHLSPKDVHFHCPPSNFLPPLHDNGADELMSARMRSKEVVLEEVKRSIKKTPITSPTDFTNKIKVGQLALKKRSIFPQGAPKKLAFKTLIQPLKVIQKVATNSYKCINLLTQEESIVAGDLLIKVSALDERGLKKLCEDMEETVRRNAAGRGAFDGPGEEDAEEVPVRRSRRIRGQQPEIQDANLDALFRSAPST